MFKYFFTANVVWNMEKERDVLGKENARPAPARRKTSGNGLSEESTIKKENWRNVAKCNLKSIKGTERVQKPHLTQGQGNSRINHNRDHQGNVKKRVHQEKNKMPFSILLRNLSKEEDFKVLNRLFCTKFL